MTNKRSFRNRGYHPRNLIVDDDDDSDMSDYEDGDFADLIDEDELEDEEEDLEDEDEDEDPFAIFDEDEEEEEDLFDEEEEEEDEFDEEDEFEEEEDLLDEDELEEEEDLEDLDEDEEEEDLDLYEDEEEEEEEEDLLDEDEANLFRPPVHEPAAGTLLETEESEAPLPPGHRSGFVAVIGRPNVGKSTLMNAILGQKVAIVSPRPQTTRTRQLGILTEDTAQIIFIDTPGIHKPQHRLGQFMVETAGEALDEADVILFVVDSTEMPGTEDRQIAALVRARQPTPAILALNKMDRLKPKQVQSHTEAYFSLVPGAEWMMISATRGDNLDKLLELIVARLPEGPRYYPTDQISDQNIRDMVAELIREQVLRYVSEEVPHGVAVVVDEFDESQPGLARIAATIFVDRESHKAILIGRGGQMLKQIGQDARMQIEPLVDGKVYLQLWVKVRKNWRKNASDLRRFGYAR